MSFQKVTEKAAAAVTSAKMKGKKVCKTCGKIPCKCK